MSKPWGAGPGLAGRFANRVSPGGPVPPLTRAERQARKRSREAQQWREVRSFFRLLFKGVK